MGIYARNEIILNIYKNEKFIKNINNQRPDGKTALHFISSNSILGTKLFILSGADYQIYDTFENTSAKYAFYSGRFDCYDLIMEKTHDKHDFILRQKIESMRLNSKDDKLLRESLFFQDEIEYDNKISNNMDFKDLINFYEKNDYKNAKKLIKQFKDNNEILIKNNIYDLIEFSCKNRNIELLILISELKPLKNYHIGQPYIEKYGLISWLNEVVNLGIDIFSKSKLVLGNKSIFDFYLINNDKNY